ncbi:C-mannosyltransferase dpy-19 [Aphelenchoides fujianensis]|nr:C-mannosyltransferase dpy-19 [Aphelenchoides fujianensis]
MNKRKKNPPPVRTTKPTAGGDEEPDSRSFRPWILASIALLLWIPHSVYLFSLFENDRFFSHLSDMEREMSYRTEMGLYFSYYKTIVEAPSLLNGIQQITNDNVTEAGHTINTLQRFNLYPELYLGVLLRTFRQLTESRKGDLQSCFQVRRGNDLPPVMSCEGIGNMHYFYMYGVFAIAGSVLASIFLVGALISNSYVGGLLSAVAFVANHGQATRVQWTPPLRESFGYPAFALQLFFLSWILRSRRSGRFVYFAFAFLTLHFILFWQFSGFVLFTQLCCLFGTYSLNLVTLKKTASLLHLYAFAFAVGYLALFGNAMLLSSLFFTSLISFYGVLGLHRAIGLPSWSITQRVLKTAIFLVCTFTLKYAMNNWVGIRDDNHVFDILRSKFTNYSDFHTKLYTCAPEFDFVDFETLRNITTTGLLPLAALSFLLAFNLAGKLLLKNWKEPSVNERQPELVFNAGLLVCFCAMAGLIMRLKLFAVPHLCIFLPVAFNSELQQSVLRRKLPWKTAVMFACIAFVAFQGWENVRKQMSITGEFSNEQQEHLFRWIMENTPKNAVFAGSMPLMANVKLTTLRPIFNHPHYEDVGIRQRTMEVYSLYSRRTPQEVHAKLKSLGVNYIVFESQHCGEHRRPECSYLGIWDSVDPARRSQPSICSRFVEPIEQAADYQKLLPFHVVFNSFNYAVLKL